jgi:hypothetical protein
MSYLVWGSLALLAGAGGVVSTGHANTEVAAIIAAVALIASAGACIWYLIHSGSKNQFHKD